MKNHNPKKGSLYNAASLCTLKDQTITAVEYEMGESSRLQAKAMPFIPVTGSTQTLKYTKNKTTKAFCD